MEARTRLRNTYALRIDQAGARSITLITAAAAASFTP